MGTSGQVGSEINITVSMDPPLSVLANTPSSDPLRYNIIEGGNFTINCSVTFTEPYYSARVGFYKYCNRLDEYSVVQDATFLDNGTVESVLTFSDFQSSNSGYYDCYVEVFSDNSSYSDASNYREYHTGEANLQQNVWYIYMTL